MVSDKEGKRTRLMPRLALAVLAGLLLMLALAGWLLGSESGARAVFSGLASLSADTLQAKGVRGRLFGPLQVEHISLERKNQKISLENLQLDWRPPALLHGRLHITALRIGRLGLTEKIEQKPEPARLPDRIGLPFALQIDSVQVDAGQVNWGPVNLVELGALAFNLDFDGTRYRLGLERFTASSAVRSGQVAGNFKGQATLSTIKPYALQVHLSSGGKAVIRNQAVGAAGRIDMSGTLAQLTTMLDLTINGAQLQGNAVLRPFSLRPLGGATIIAQAIDLSGLVPGLPRTALDINLTATEDGTGELAMNNIASGLYNENKIPVAAFLIAFRQEDGHFNFDRIVARLGTDKRPAGIINGSGRYTDGALTLNLRTDSLDLQRLDQRARATRLAGSVDVRHVAGKQEFVVALTEPLAKNKLMLSARAVLADNGVAIDRAELRAGDSRVNASGHVDLSGRQSFSATGRVSRFKLQDLGDFKQFPALDLNGNFSVEGTRQPQLAAELAFGIADSRLAGQPLSGDGRVQLHADSVIVPKFLLIAGANRLSVQGQLSHGDARLTFALAAPKLEQLGAGFGGALQAGGSVRGSFAQPHIKADWQASKVRAPGQFQIETMHGTADVRIDKSKPFFINTAVVDASTHGLRSGAQQLAALTAQLQFASQPNAPLKLTLRADGMAAGQWRGETFSAHVDGTTAQHTLRATLAEAGQTWALDANGGLHDLGRAPRWQGTVSRFDAAGRFKASLSVPAALSVSQQRVQLDQFRLDSDTAHIVVDQFTRTANAGKGMGTIVTRGHFERLQVAQALRFVKPAPPVTTDLQLGGEWNMTIADTVAGSIKMRRERGDLTVRGGAPFTLGLRTLEATAVAGGGKLTLQLLADGRQLGHIDVNAGTRIGNGENRLSIAADAPVSGSAAIDIPSLAWVGPLVSASTITEGRLQSNISVGGTFDDPRFSGQIAGSALRVTLGDLGVDLRQGALQSEFQGEQLIVKSLRFQSENGGSLAMSGPITLADGQVAAQLALVAQRYALLNRVDRRLVLSGQSQVSWRESRARISGVFKVDSGFFDIGRADTPQLSSDVVIVGRSKKPAAQTAVALDLAIGLGDGVTLRGRGLDALLAGEIRLANEARETLNAIGTLRIVKGTYSAYGRELAIEQGVLRFSGPLNNPALNILAMRRDQEVEAGVSVLGTALAPRVTLVSTPTVPDAEKLSWLVLGRGLGSAGAGDLGALQSAAAALLSEGAASGVQSQIATGFGLDQFSIGTSADNLQQRIVTLGKQISSKLYVSYQQGLEAARSVVLLRYTLTPRLTIEAEAGTQSAISLFYNFAFD